MAEHPYLLRRLAPLWSEEKAVAEQEVVAEREDVAEQEAVVATTLCGAVH